MKPIAKMGIFFICQTLEVAVWRIKMIGLLKGFFNVIFLFGILVVWSINGAWADENQLQNMDARLRTIENYLETLRPTLLNFSGNIQEGLASYTRELEKNLDAYTQQLQESLDDQLAGQQDRKVILDTRSHAFQKVVTNTGIFLISVDKMEAVSNGYRLYLQIGNINYADFRNFTLRLIWGAPWNAGSKLSREQWRQSLMGAEYSFEGRLEKGKWNSVEVDLIPASAQQMEYIECEMGVASIELEK